MLTIENEELRQLARYSPETLGDLIRRLAVVDRGYANPKPGRNWVRGSMGPYAAARYGASAFESVTCHTPESEVSYTFLTKNNGDRVEVAEGEGWAVGRFNDGGWAIINVDRERDPPRDGREGSEDNPWNPPPRKSWTDHDFDWEEQIAKHPSAVISRIAVCARLMRIGWASHVRIGHDQVERGVHTPQASMIEALEKALGIVTPATRHHTIGERLRTIEERLR